MNRFFLHKAQRIRAGNGGDFDHAANTSRYSRKRLNTRGSPNEMNGKVYTILKRKHPIRNTVLKVCSKLLKKELYPVIIKTKFGGGWMPPDIVSL